MSDTKLLYEKQTAFQNVRIEKHPIWGKLLRLDGLIQSSELDKDLYHASLVQPAFGINPAIKSVFVIEGVS